MTTMKWKPLLALCINAFLSSITTNAFTTSFRTTNSFGSSIRLQLNKPLPQQQSRRCSSFLASAKDDKTEGNIQGQDEETLSSSGIEGNRRAPTAREISIMDEMITKLANCKPYELPGAISQAIRVVSSPRFFLRIAERRDMEESEVEKEKLAALADNLVRTLEAVVSTAEDKMAETAVNVENVVKAAAEPDSGEFLVPLLPERVEAMRSVLEKLEPTSLNEGFLSTVDAWMNKSMEDGLDGMVNILQKLLQIYAGTAISRAREALQAQVGAAVTGSNPDEVEQAIAASQDGATKPASALFEDLLAEDTDKWDATLQNRLGTEEDGITPQALLIEVQRTIEGVVLGLENGSMAQRVQAEYLRELVSRIEAVEQRLQ